MASSTPQHWWLQASLEDGAGRLGPLPATVDIGTDPERCHVVLARHLRLSPHHLSLVSEGRGWRLHYAHGVKPLLRWERGRGRAPWPQGALLQHGDAIAFGAKGPHLTLMQGTDVLPSQGAVTVGVTVQDHTKASTHAKALTTEATRQAQVHVRQRLPWVQQLDHAVRQATGRSITDPLLLTGVGLGFLFIMLGTMGIVVLALQ
ncbi:MAG: hypothetical protein ACON4N_02845 [Myxococcota bacterium]